MKQWTGKWWSQASCVLVAMLLAWPAMAQNKDRVEILWLGQSAMRITAPNGKVIMLDPWITTNPLAPEPYKSNLDALGKLDVILVTHAHGDHLGDGPTLAKKLGIPLWGPAGLDQSLVTLGVLPAKLAPRMGKGGTITPIGSDVKVSQVHAEHSSELLWTNPATGKKETKLGGEPVGFIIHFKDGFTIYHMGDTALFGDMKMIRDYYKPDLIMIPIGGHYVMDPTEAAYATNHYLKPKYAIPMHYGTNPYLVGTPAEYMKAMGKSRTHVFPMKPGDTLVCEGKHCALKKS
jgi:L-ascorbate metabolism protein UlaG (beta-lactamase superfamily)